MLKTDQRGAVTAVTVPDQDKPVWQSQINSWGLAANDKEKDFDPKLRLVNQYFDEETGLHYNVARYYDPRMGRFISPDPSGITDSVDPDTPSTLKLDTTVYASGQPDGFFDPDGAAKVTFYAITTGAKGKALGTTQGFTKARWAFVIEDIKEVKIQGNAALGELNKKYATNKTTTAVDKGGDFIGGGAVSKTSNDSSARVSLIEHYGSNLIAATQFTVDDFDDEDATLLIASFNKADLETLGQCPAISALLPTIKFAPGEDNIDVTKAAGSSAYPATVQRIINCNINQRSTLPVRYASEEERQRVEKIEAAAQGVETSSLDKDCSTSGCPGVDIVGQAGHVYHASYGRTQFVGDTFLETVSKLQSADQLALGLNADMQRRLKAARIRASSAVKKFTDVRNGTTCENAATYWDNAGQPGAMTLTARTQFTTQTGLGRQALIDMACFEPAPPARPKGEARQAFATEAIFTDTVLRDWMMEIFKSNDQFNFVSKTLIRDNLRAVLGQSALSGQFVNRDTPGTDAYLARQRAIERNVAMRTARAHNSGIGEGSNAFATNIETLLQSDALSYVSKFLGPNGNWTSTRCATPTNAQATWHGLQLTPIQL